MKHPAIVSALASLAGLLLWMAGCQGCALVTPEGSASYEIAAP